MSLRSVIYASFLGAALVLSTAAGATSEQIDHSSEWRADVAQILAPDRLEQARFTIDPESLGDSNVGPITVQIAGMSKGDYAGAYSVNVVEPFDLRGSNYLVKPAEDGYEAWKYIPALRRVKKVDSESFLHPGIRTLVRLKSVLKQTDWSEAQFELADHNEKVHLLHEIPGACGKLRATIDSDTRFVHELELLGQDGEQCAFIDVKKYENIAGDPVPTQFKVELAAVSRPEPETSS